MGNILISGEDFPFVDNTGVKNYCDES